MQSLHLVFMLFSILSYLDDSFYLGFKFIDVDNWLIILNFAE